jgi:hypothetical protein
MLPMYFSACNVAHALPDASQMPGGYDLAEGAASSRAA